MKLFSRARNTVGRVSGYGSCHRCGDSWSWKPEHITDYSETNGCFPLCEECWSVLTPDERLPFYAELVADWASGRTKGEFDHTREYIVELLDRWPRIRAAVEAGL